MTWERICTGSQPASNVCSFRSAILGVLTVVLLSRECEGLGNWKLQHQLGGVPPGNPNSNIESTFFLSHGFFGTSPLSCRRSACAFDTATRWGRYTQPQLRKRRVEHSVPILRTSGCSPSDVGFNASIAKNRFAGQPAWRVHQRPSACATSSFRRCLVRRVDDYVAFAEHPGDRPFGSCPDFCRHPYWCYGAINIRGHAPKCLPNNAQHVRCNCRGVHLNYRRI